MINWGTGHKDFHFSSRFQDDRLGDTQNVSSNYLSVQIVVSFARYLKKSVEKINRYL